MQIKELIEILNKAPDQNHEVWITDHKGDFTTNIDYRIDNHGDMILLKKREKKQQTYPLAK